jgi:hypothetical protein
MTQFRVKTTAETFYGILQLLQSGDPFIYTRFGDGELEVMLGGGGGGQLPDPALTDETWKLFHDTEHANNLIGLARHKNEPGMSAGLFEGWKNPKYTFADQPREFENAIALHYIATFKPHLLQKLIELIRNRPKFYVGALDGPALEFFWGPYTHIKVPQFNAYSEINEWQAALETVIADEPLPLVLYAAGPAKCASAWRLLESGPPVQAIDVGSLVDLVLGVQSRTWIKLVQEGNV